MPKGKHGIKKTRSQAAVRRLTAIALVRVAIDLIMDHVDHR